MPFLMNDSHLRGQEGKRMKKQDGFEKSQKKLRSIKVLICSLKNNPHYCREGVKVLHVSERQMTKWESSEITESKDSLKWCREEVKPCWYLRFSSCFSVCVCVCACLCPCIITTYYNKHSPAVNTLQLTSLGHWRHKDKAYPESSQRAFHSQSYRSAVSQSHSACSHLCSPPWDGSL